MAQWYCFQYYPLLLSTLDSVIVTYNKFIILCCHYQKCCSSSPCYAKVPITYSVLFYLSFLFYILNSSIFSWEYKILKYIFPILYNLSLTRDSYFKVFCITLSPFYLDTFNMLNYFFNFLNYEKNIYANFLSINYQNPYLCCTFIKPKKETCYMQL